MRYENTLRTKQLRRDGGIDNIVRHYRLYLQLRQVDPLVRRLSTIEFRVEVGGDVIIKRRILMVAPTSFFSDYGCHVRILEEMRSLRKRGHVVELCTYHNGRDVDGFQIHRTVDIPWRRRAIVGSSKHKIYLDIALALLVLRRVASFRPDIIHAHLHEGALIGSLAGLLFRKPVVFDYQGSLVEEMIDHGFVGAVGWRTRFMRWLERRIDAMPSIIAPSSEAGANYLIASGVDADRVKVVSDAVDLDRFDPDSDRAADRRWRERLGIPASARVVVYLGLLADYQGTASLIRAADLFLERDRKAYVLIAGYPSVGRYSQMASESKHSSRILFPGRIPYDEAPALLATADVAVAPKRSVTEANGKVLNYMAMNLPTVATDTPINRDLLGTQGWFVEPGNPSALAAGIETVLADRRVPSGPLRERVAERFSWDQRILDIEAIYDRVLGRPVAVQKPAKGSVAEPASQND